MGKTRRNYGIKTSIHNIIKILPYNREEIQLYTPENIRNKEGKTFTDKHYGDNLLNFLPNKYRWQLENNPKKCCRDLANLLNKQIVLNYEDTGFDKTSKLLLDRDAPNYYMYRISIPKQLKFTPNITNNDIINDINYDVFDFDITEYLKQYSNIAIFIKPDAKHYLLNSEYRKTPNQTCGCCFRSNGRIYQKKGTGKKSSSKTKGYKSENVENMNNLIEEYL